MRIAKIFDKLFSWCLLLGSLSWFIACVQSPRDKQQQGSSQQSAADASASPLSFMKPESWQKSNDASRLNDWLAYYQRIDSSFSLHRFILQDSSTYQLMESSSRGLDLDGLDSVYRALLVFSPKADAYLDLDSYLWRLNPQGHMDFSADQQVSLVDLTNKKSFRVAFFGPSYRVEEGLWLTGHELLLLGIEHSNRPFAYRINLAKGMLFDYRYPGSIALKGSEQQYLFQRIAR